MSDRTKKKETGIGDGFPLARLLPRRAPGARGKAKEGEDRTRTRQPFRPGEGSRCRERRARRTRARLTGRHGGWSGAKVEKRESRQRGSVDARLGESEKGENLSKPLPKKCYGGHSTESGGGYRTGNRPPKRRPTAKPRRRDSSGEEERTRATRLRDGSPTRMDRRNQAAF